MRVFVTGGTGHTGSYIIPDLIAAGHEVTGLARADTAAAVSALGAKVRRGDLKLARPAVWSVADLSHIPAELPTRSAPRRETLLRGATQHKSELRLRATGRNLLEPKTRG